MRSCLGRAQPCSVGVTALSPGGVAHPPHLLLASERAEVAGPGVKIVE